MQVPYGEGVAIRIGPEPCADVERWLLGRLRHHTFHSLAEVKPDLNRAGVQVGSKRRYKSAQCTILIAFGRYAQLHGGA